MQIRRGVDSSGPARRRTRQPAFRAHASQAIRRWLRSRRGLRCTVGTPLRLPVRATCFKSSGSRDRGIARVLARCENAEFTGAVGAARRSAVSQRRAATMTATAARTDAARRWRRVGMAPWRAGAENHDRRPAEPDARERTNPIDGGRRGRDDRSVWSLRVVSCCWCSTRRWNGPPRPRLRRGPSRSVNSCRPIRPAISIRRCW